VLACISYAQVPRVELFTPTSGLYSKACESKAEIGESFSRIRKSDLRGRDGGYRKEDRLLAKFTLVINAEVEEPPAGGMCRYGLISTNVMQV
jgi:hypothetical protein